jgi:hypothetical protein
MHKVCWNQGRLCWRYIKQFSFYLCISVLINWVPELYNVTLYDKKVTSFYWSHFLNSFVEIFNCRSVYFQYHFILSKILQFMHSSVCVSDFPWSKRVREVLNSVFKLNGFRPLQHETINATMSKEDVILIMPTGGGKSLCYQLPALLKSGNVKVV